MRKTVENRQRKDTTTGHGSEAGGDPTGVVAFYQ